ncbi:Metal-dependent DNA hydrolase of TatD family [Alkalihalophilus pseudofirmus OF4]|uniref:Metal-dependent DNA hydrolase of TatD family n=1 Tax=Alkalihalophilus pseudofirmus (strain ATCC BAA-2126 / JCM 17055 / OF4) TaxID=398511 RepID=D3FQZ4_ALKPO|nr:TatD family hydrolase [Alkalihalophilus pseudofirmus]ADC49690.1 Metal-dependent DNA hydrolase of TatD family [Alkalihalophilus pseudofirmus OF4]OLS34565.1 hydrolase TatD [Alkalihalophilus pseudofirmus]
MLFDTHVHLNADQFEDDVEEVINRAKEAGVSEMVVVGFDEKTINRALELIEKYDMLYAAVGWHPVDAIDMKDEHLVWLEELAAHPKVVALGEMGLDYHWDKSPKEIQKEVFRKQIQLAKKVKLPIVIHNREADQDIVDILEEEKAEEVGGIMHCFGGSVEIAERCLKMNFYISLGGPVTFKNARRPKEVAKHIPMDRLLIETDCPYLAPHPYRGKRNEPAYVKLVAEEIAGLKEVNVDEVANTTRENAKRLFGINR